MLDSILRYSAIIFIALNLKVAHAQTFVAFENEVILQPKVNRINRVEVTDFNFDNSNDFIIVDDFQKLHFIQNTGNTKFDKVAEYRSARQIVNLTYDFNNDGLRDHFFIENDSLFYALQNCNFSFEPEVEIYHTPESDVNFFTYFNNDNKLDLVSISIDSIWQMKIVFADEMGNYLDANKTTIDFLDEFKFYTFGDFNQNNFKELIQLEKYPESEFRIKLTQFDENGNFNDKVIDSKVDSTLTLRTLISADLNADKQDELIVLYHKNLTDTYIEIYSFKENFEFEKQILEIEDVQISFIAAQDLFNDGFPELMYSNTYFQNINGVIFPVVSNYQYAPGLILSNFNKEDNIDALYITNSFLSGDSKLELLSNFNGLFFEDSLLVYPQSESLVLDEIYSFDFNKDAAVDIYGLTRDRQSVVFLKNDGQANFEQAQTIKSKLSSPISYFDHINNIKDNRNDFVIVHDIFQAEDSVFVYVQNEDKQYDTLYIESIQLQNITDIKTMDIDKDGDYDILVIDNTQHCSVYENKGNYSFDLSQYFRLHSTELLLVDINGDGHIDIAPVVNGINTSSLLNLFYNDGDGQFNEYLIFNIPTNFSSGNYVFYDFNSDGLEDLVFLNANYPNQIFYFYKNCGLDNFQIAGTLESKIFDIVLLGWNNFKVTDFNADGYFDILAIGYFAGNIKKELILYSDGDFNFQMDNNLNEHFTSIFDAPIILEDFNSDNDLDLVFINRQAGTLGILKNQLLQDPFLSENAPLYANCHHYQLDKIYAAIKLNIFNTNGQHIESSTLYDTDKLEFNFTASKGMYIIQAVTNTGETFQYKVVK